MYLKWDARPLEISTHMPLARHDLTISESCADTRISTHMPLARHDIKPYILVIVRHHFYSHASCEA